MEENISVTFQFKFEASWHTVIRKKVLLTTSPAGIVSYESERKQQFLVVTFLVQLDKNWYVFFSILNYDCLQA